MCLCEFSDNPDSPEPDGEPWHFRRECKVCGAVWWSLHCAHDGIQRPCPNGHINEVEPDDEDGVTPCRS